MCWYDRLGRRKGGLSGTGNYSTSAVLTKTEKQKPVAKEFMHLACLGMKLEFSELREFTYGFFTHLAEVLGEDFLEFLPAALTFALASCHSSDGVIYYRSEEDQGTSKANKKKKPSHTPKGIYATKTKNASKHTLCAYPVVTEGVAGIEQERTVNPLHVSIPQAFLDEKSAACHAVGALAKYVGPPFMPCVLSCPHTKLLRSTRFMPKSLEMMLEMSNYGFTDARQNAVTSLAGIQSFVSTFVLLEVQSS